MTFLTEGKLLMLHISRYFYSKSILRNIIVSQQLCKKDFAVINRKNISAAADYRNYMLDFNFEDGSIPKNSIVNK